MTQQRKPTAGALRAANIIADDHRVGIHDTRHREWMAQIIDREMVQPDVAELLKAFKDFVNTIKAYKSLLFRADVMLAEGAIAKVESQQRE